MPGLDPRAVREREMHREVAGMYQRRSRLAFAEAFQQERNDLLLSLVPPAASLSVLDLGCGSGVILNRLAERHDRVLGLDLSEEMLAAYEPAPGTTVELVQGDMHALPFDDASVDAVICRSALHHMDDEVAVLREVQRVLRPGGRLVLGEPANDNLLTRLARWWVRRRPSYGKVHTIDRAYTRRQLREMFAAAGLEVEHEIRFGFIAYPLCDNPELVPVLTWLPFADTIAVGLRAVDRFLSLVPVIRGQSWYTILAVRRAK